MNETNFRPAEAYWQDEAEGATLQTDQASDFPRAALPKRQ